MGDGHAILCTKYNWLDALPWEGQKKPYYLLFPDLTQWQNKQTKEFFPDLYYRQTRRRKIDGYDVLTTFFVLHRKVFVTKVRSRRKAKVL